MRGRKPQNIVAGSSPVTEIPKAPVWLSKEAKAEWRRVAPILVNERKILTEADLSLFASYCTAVGNVQAAQRVLNREGMVIATPAGPKRHPVSVAQKDAMQMALRAGVELGLTPSSRSRPAMRDGADDDEASALFG